MAVCSFHKLSGVCSLLLQVYADNTTCGQVMNEAICGAGFRVNADTLNRSVANLVINGSDAQASCCERVRMLLGTMYTISTVRQLHDGLSCPSFWLIDHSYW